MIKEILQASKNIAILGLSNDINKPSYMVGEYLLNNGYNIIPIHPKYDEILGIKTYKSLQEIDVRIDILNVFRKSEAIFGIAQEVLALKNKPKCMWVQLGIESKESKELLENSDIFYVENLCIKLEHKRLFR
ncbi:MULTISPECIES: CoA-binding protein [Helicobacter]|uniref:CoA-binding protein n=1 Tax=Helicobacter ibis TaxID=2962633 RepID=A0ABT4VF04_9HELI|nr:MULTISPECIES: CoA-binding protein [Helicobacter]MDA3967162.1 CoA-binding protein [Helicobacter sp. WB40]MDA3969290.1 CoA-binding protein [Helicobacter ibis]